MLLVSGTQAERAEQNKLSVMRISELHKTKHDDGNTSDNSDDDNDSDDDDDAAAAAVDVDPVVEARSLAHHGAVNRVRCMPQHSAIVAAMADTGHLRIYDLTKLHDSLTMSATAAAAAGNNNPTHFKYDPLYSHKLATEGYALDWSSTTRGQLVSGDCYGSILLHTMNEQGTSWSSSCSNNTSASAATASGGYGQQFLGHNKSIEDLQWSPSQDRVFASCSADKTIRIWDTRSSSNTPNSCAQFVVAHKSDVNVISWNRNVQHLLASGGDEGGLKVWDLRNFKSTQHAAYFSYHKQAITSVEWHPTDESVLAASSADNQLTIWDLALEADAEEERELGVGAVVGGTAGAAALPPQLFFVHQGQQNVKEIHWHKNINHAIVSTAEDGFNVFISSNMEQTV